MSQKLQFSRRYVFNRMCVDPTSRILPMLTAGLQKFTAAFLLRRKTPETYFFRLKNSHFTKFTAKCMAESVNSLSRWKKVEYALYNSCWLNLTSTNQHRQM